MTVQPRWVELRRSDQSQVGRSTKIATKLEDPLDPAARMPRTRRSLIGGISEGARRPDEAVCRGCASL